jgi:HSP20 family protein
MPKSKKPTTEKRSTIRPTETPPPVFDRDTDAWFADDQYDGQLAVDVYQTQESIIIKSAIAGVAPEDLDIAVHRDIVTIRGRRKRQEQVSQEDYLFQECYWGSFSRSIILPTEVDANRVSATITSGILRIVLPKSISAGPRRITVESDDV